jgi:hypothetical protein
VARKKGFSNNDLMREEANPMTNNSSISTTTLHTHNGNSASAKPPSGGNDARASRDQSGADKSYGVMLMCLLPQSARDVLSGSSCPYTSGQYTEF